MDTYRSTGIMHPNFTVLATLLSWLTTEILLYFLLLEHNLHGYADINLIPEVVISPDVHRANDAREK